MAQQIINIGTGNNTGDGEGLRDGGLKINANFTELYPQVDANTLKVSADGSIDTHSDVDLSGVTIGQNWILKYNGSSFIPCMKSIIRDSTISINTTTTPQDKINIPINFQRTGFYRVRITYSHSYDATNSSIVTRATIGGNNLSNIANGELLRKEPKDSGGNDGDGRGTSQKETACNEFYYNVVSTGNQNVVFDFNATATGVEASIWDLSIVIEEELI